MDSTVVQSANQLMEILGIIILFGLIFGKISNRVKMPDVVLYILAGILLGPNLLNWVNIEKYPVENQLILSFGAAYILYDGGREINFKILNQVKISVTLLSTLGVFISTVVVGYVAQIAFGIPIEYAMLLGAVIASTDPSVLVPLFKNMNISDKLKQTIISESAFNDAAGAIITFAILGVIMGGSFSVGSSLLELVTTVLGGLVIGAIIGYGTHVLIDEGPAGLFKDHPTELILVAVAGAYLLSNHFHFSGFMAVFIVGMICGNKKRFHFWIPEEHFQTHMQFKEVLTIILRMMIFVVLGTQLIFGDIIEYLWPTLIVVATLVFVARPLSVLACIVVDREAKWSWKEIVYMMWVRETGVIPAALAGMLVTSGITHSDIISSVTFATILITLTFQASTSKVLAKALKLDLGEQK